MLRPTSLVACGLLTVFALLCLEAIWDQSATYDEPAFLLAGYSYLVPGGPEVPTNNLRLSQLWMGWPQLALHPHLPDAIAQETGLETTVDCSDAGSQFLYDPRNRTEAMLHVGRLSILVLGVALGALVFGWSRRLHGNFAGLVALGFFTLDPLIIANSSLATTDLAVALLFTVATAAGWRFLHRLSWGTALLFGISVGALCATKLTGVLFVPIGALLSLIAAWRNGHGFRWGLWFGLLTASLLAAYVTLWGIYGFRFAAGQPLGESTWYLAKAGIEGRMLEFCRIHQLLPQDFLFDCQRMMHKVSRRSFLYGQYSVEGFLAFYPVAILVKSTPALITALALVVGCGLAALIRRVPQGAGLDWYGLVPAGAVIAVYGAVAVFSRFDIGIRLILPIYPMLCIVGGAVVRAAWPPRPWLQLAVAVLAVDSAWEVWRARPDYLAYFNSFVGGPDNGYRVLVDSSCEWGENLPALAQWLAHSRVRRPVYFSYFGTASISHYHIDAVLLPQEPERRSRMELRIGPGTYVLSATMLESMGGGPVWGPWRASLESDYQRVIRQLKMGRMSDRRRDQELRWYDQLRFGRLCAYLRHRIPDVRVAPNLLVFDLGNDELTQALTGPAPELGGPIKGADRLPPYSKPFLP